MSSLMMYVEENLLNEDSESYTEEVVSSEDNEASKSTEVVPSKDNKANESTEVVPTKDNIANDSSEESANVPLVSPESTLADKPLKLPPGLMVTPEALNPQKFLEENDIKGFSSDLPEIQESPKLSALNSTNPFLQDEPTSDDKQCIVSPQQFLDLWQEYLRLQMQITAAFDTLLNSVIENAMKKDKRTLENGTMGNVQRQMNSVVEKLAAGDIGTPLKNDAFHANKQICDTNSQMQINNTFLYQDDTNRTSDYDAPDFNFGKVRYSNENTLFPAMDYHQVQTHIVPRPENVYCDSYPNFSQNISDRNIAKDRNTNSVVQTCNNYDVMSNFLFVNGETPRNENVLQVEPAETENTGYSDHQNDFLNNAKNDFSTEVYKHNSNVFKETNPFRLSMAGKLRITDLPNDSPTHISKKPTTEHNSSSDDFYLHRAKVKGLIDVPLKTDYSYKDSSAISDDTKKSTGCENFFSKHFYANASINDSLAVSNNDYVFTDYECRSINNGTPKVTVEPSPGMYNAKKGSKMESLGDANIAKAEICNRSSDTGKRNCTFNPPRSPFSYKSVNLDDDPFSYFTPKKQENDPTFRSFTSSPRSPAFTDYRIEDYIEKIWRQPDNNCRHNSSEYSNSFFTSDENCNGDVVSNNVQATSNYLNSNIYGSSWFPINSFSSSLLTDYANVDEGYITRSSTCQTLENPSVFEPNCDADNNLQLFGNKLGVENNLLSFGKKLDVENNLQSFGKKLDVENKLQSFGKKLECSMSAETWMRSVENTINSQYPDGKQVGPTQTESHGVPLMGRSFINFDELSDETRIKLSMKNFNEETSQDSHNRRDCFKHAKLDVAHTEGCNRKELVPFGQESSTHERSSLASKFFVQTVELPKRTMHVFHFRNDGWLMMDEFIEAFTALGTLSAMINLLHTLDVHLQIQEIKRSEYPVEFARLDRELPNVTIIRGDKRGNISLIPLKSTLRILSRLRIISPRDVDDALRGKKYHNNIIVHEIWMIIKAYGKFKRVLENGQ